MQARDLKKFILCLLLMLALPAGLSAADRDEIRNLDKQYNDLLASGHYKEAEPIAKQMLAIAERDFADKPQIIAVFLNNLANLFCFQDRYAEAEPLYKKALAIQEKALGKEHPDVAANLNILAVLYWNQGRYAEAEPFFKRSLAIREKALGLEHADVAASLNYLALLYVDQGRYTEAEPLYKRALAIREKALGPEHPDVASSLNNLATLYKIKGRYAEAEPLLKRSLAIKEKLLGTEHPDVARSLNNLALLYDDQGRYAEAEPLCKRALAIYEKTLVPDNPDVAQSLNILAVLYEIQGRYAEAEPLYIRALAIREKAGGSEHPDVAQSLNNLALLYKDQGRYAEAEPLHKRSLAIDEKTYGVNHPDVAADLNNLAELYRVQGRYAEAEPLYKRSLATWEKARGKEHPLVANSLDNLAILYGIQGRYAEAEPLCKRALAIEEKSLGSEHPSVAGSLNNLAILYKNQSRYAEAEPLYKRALAITEKALGAGHPRVADNLNNIALLYEIQGRYAEAEPLYKRALAIREKTLGAEHPDVAPSLDSLALLYYEQGRYAEAEPLIVRTIEILDHTNVDPDMHCKGYWLKAELAWKTQHQDQAVADLRRAMQFAEDFRSKSSGGEVQQAQAFGQYTSAFETMVDWQTELGHPAEGLDAMERSRARSLIDQMSSAHADLLAGLDEGAANELRRREQQAQAMIATLQKQAESLAKRRDLSDAQRAAETQKLEAELHTARQTYADVYADIRNASPAYRLALGSDRKPISLEELKKKAAEQKALVLEYLLGEEGGYLLIIPGAGEPHLIKLDINKEQADKLGIKEGPLTNNLLNVILQNEKKTGILQILKDPESKNYKQAIDSLGVLWELLIPEAERQALEAGKFLRLIVIPDGSLAQLPFETLVVKQGEKPEFLLDAGPPIIYAPSATIFMNLAKLETKTPSSGKGQVLSVGDCHYDGRSAALSRYGSVGGTLSPLYYSGQEIQWVSNVFGKAGTKVDLLKADQATKANVRRDAPQRQILHFACHGLVDQAYGNLFGALAFTPGANPDNPSDDGFLTLPEIYELNLKGCELAILSACETNLGPQQKGEGVWALSRGFLVAGSRRVVASNWLVDDEAAATLVSYYCSGLAQSEKAGNTPDYAQALQTAKRLVRQNKKWEHPYYWAMFELVGPN